MHVAKVVRDNRQGFKLCPCRGRVSGTLKRNIFVNRSFILNRRHLEYCLVVLNILTSCIIYL